MATEKEKMLAGQPYFAADPTLVAERARSHSLCQQMRKTDPRDTDLLQKLFSELLGKPTNAFVTPPFFCDYGYNIELGNDVYFNTNCVILDVVPVKIGSRTLFGPNVQLYPATHPLDAKERSTGIESGAPITIGNDVWIGGGVIICPGVAIGDRSVIGAGSVVTKDIPSDVVAVGNPCKVIKKL